MNKKIILILLGALIVGLCFLPTNDKKENLELNYTFDDNIYKIDDKEYSISEDATNMVAIEVKNYGLIIASLYPDDAPITVENFKNLVEDDFYDGLTFHRVVSNFVIQTGDPTATGSGGSDETITGEFSLNGIDNNISHKRGVLSMARSSNDMNSASSQFFIVQKDAAYLDGNYAGFGEVVSGMEVVDAVASVQTDQYDKPLKDIIITSISFVNEEN